MKYLFVFLLFFSIYNLSGQTYKATDTVYHHHHYNSLIRYRQSDDRMILTGEGKPWYAFGNFKKDSLKNGRWIYFTPEGTVYAKGRYRNGKKKGHWKYGSLEVAYPPGWQVTDVVTVNKDNIIRIHDVVKIKGDIRTYYCDNGTSRPSPAFGCFYFSEDDHCTDP